MYQKITDSVYYCGVDDKTLDLFESQYKVPKGVSYNSYAILDQKIALLDTCDQRGTSEWISNVEAVLDGKTPNYLIVSHMEPDHAANIKRIAEKYPQMQLVVNTKTLNLLKQFFNEDYSDRAHIVAEGDKLELGEHTLTFIMAPMVHWPEVMVTYDSKDKILFSADGFGKFGASDADEDWTCEARRYYFNIVGKYGMQVQTLLKKAAALDIAMICPLHGPILTENLSYYIDKYNIWSSYTPEDKGILLAYASIHGNTKNAALKLADILREKGAEKVAVTDLSRDDMAEAVEDAFRYDRMIVLASSYDAGVFPPMEEFLLHLKSKAYQNRKIGFVENGSWAPSAARTMKAIADNFKNVTYADTVVTIRSACKQSDVSALEKLADEMISK